MSFRFVGNLFSVWLELLEINVHHGTFKRWYYWRCNESDDVLVPDLGVVKLKLPCDLFFF